MTVLTPEHYRAAVEELLAPVAERVIARPPDTLAIEEPGLVGRVCAEDTRSGGPLPPFDNSQMDGYAVRTEDLRRASPEHPVSLRLGVATAAGDPPLVHVPGTAAPVMTGAAIPSGADAVVPVEATLPPRFPALSRSAETLTPATVAFPGACAAGAFVRRAGEDVRAGELLVEAGVRLTPTLVGVLAGAGIRRVPVRSRMRILVCSTGDELASTGDELAGSEPGDVRRGSIHDANGPMLAAHLREAGAEVRLARCKDDPTVLRELVEAELADGEFDLLVTSGGISAGAFEVVKEAFSPLGVEFRTIAMQPGGPQGSGLLSLPEPQSRLTTVCFPGNPVSALLSAELFLAPTLRRLAGRSSRGAEAQWRPLAVDAEAPEHKLQLRRCRLETDGSVTPLPPGSHLLHDLATADVIAEIPVGTAFCRAGTPVYTWSINV